MKYIILIFLIYFSLYADDATYKGDGATVFPISNNQIQMLHEKVVCSGYQKMQVEMTATYKNFGPAAMVQMGFPSLQYLPDKNDIYETDYFDPHFKTFVNGESVPVTLKRSKEHPELKHINFPTAYTFNVHFDENEEKTIRHTYTAGGFASSIGDYEFKYILVTGGLWKDKINNIEVEMRIPQDRGFDIISPQEHSCRFDQNLNRVILSWTYENIEPDFNIVVKILGWLERNKTPNRHIKDSAGFIKRYGKPGIRYLRNLIFAYYGYPFKNPIIRGAFYSPKSNIYTENENYSEEYISTYHKEFLKYLSLLESKNEDYTVDILKSYQKEFPILSSLNYPEIDEKSNIYLNTIDWVYRNFTLDRSIVQYSTYVKLYGKLGVDYLRNLVYAHYGYPFKNNVYREAFYYSGQYSENDNYSEKMISSYHMEFVKKLIELEKKYK